MKLCTFCGIVIFTFFIAIGIRIEFYNDYQEQNNFKVESLEYILTNGHILITYNKTKKLCDVEAILSAENSTSTKTLKFIQGYIKTSLNQLVFCKFK